MTDTEPTDALRVRRPPAGLTRAERRDWRDQEAQRLADLRAQVPAAGLRGVMATRPPRALGRSGRRVWREADRESRSRLVRAEAERTESDRYVGTMMVLAAVAVVIVLRLFVFTPESTDPAPTPTTTPTVNVTFVTTAPAQAPAGRGE